MIFFLTDYYISNLFRNKDSSEILPYGYMKYSYGKMSSILQCLDFAIKLQAMYGKFRGKRNSEMFVIVCRASDQRD